MRGGGNVKVEVGEPARSLETNEPINMDEGGGLQPVCMFLTSLEKVNDNCLGCVGTKGEKFCTKPKQGTGELDTCGTISHARKALVETDHIYFWDSSKDHGFQAPSLNRAIPLADSILDLKAVSWI